MITVKTRIFRKLYIFIIFVVGLSFWALVKNVGLPEVRPVINTLSSNRYIDRVQIISNQLNALEGEIAAQRVHSSVLLNKLRQKYAVPPPPEIESNIDATKPENPISSAGDKIKQDSEKLLALQKELEQEAHDEGEVNSRGVETGNLNNNNNNNNDVAKEVIDDNDLVEETQKKHTTDEAVIGILVFVCDRPSVKRCLDQLIKYRPDPVRFPIIVSQDCGSHPPTTAVLQSYGDQFTHIMQPDLSEIQVPPKEKKLKGYYNIARHYGWALNYTFNHCPSEYFAATLPIMRKDPTVWCVSAWNDNGKPKRINESAFDLLLRTDFFPGLGWMLTKELWKELMIKWPRSYWDDWMREPAQRRDRACIRPEISRSSTFGKYGVSHGTYFQNHLRFIKLNDHFVPFTKSDLSYLLKEKYDLDFVRKVYSSQPVQSVDELMRVTADQSNRNEFRLTYRTKADFRLWAKKLEIMDDFRAGVPRTAYRGVVPFVYNNRESYQP